MTHAEYKKVYETQQDITTKVRRITSVKHELYTVEQVKWALCALDNKRAWIDENNSVPYGHYSLQPPMEY